MKTKSFFTLLVAVVLCFYGCGKTETEELIFPDTPTDVTDPDESDGNSSGETYEFIGNGTAENPYTVADAIRFISAELYSSDKIYYVKGIISKIWSWTSFGDGAGDCINYYISDDGVATDNDLYIKWGYDFNRERFTSSSRGLYSGDEVVVYGALSFDDNTPMMKEGILYSLNGKTADEDEDDFPELSDLEDVEDVCTKMTDSNFIQYCLENFDTNGDGMISMEEARTVSMINCSSVEDFAGIEYFTNLRRFTSTSARYLDLRYNKELTSLYVANSYIEELDLRYNTNITELEEKSLHECTNLVSILLPEGLTSIGRSALASCSSLKTITLPARLITIERGAFSSCRKLTSISLPEGLTSMGSYAFDACTSLTTVTLPNSLTSIGEYAFIDCTGLTTVTLPEGLTSIETSTFERCTSLTTITLPEGLTSIGLDAFRSCTSLNTITFPDSLASLGHYCFRGSGLSSVTLPKGLTTMDYAFYECTKLTSVVLPEDLKTTGKYTFYKCSSLKSISFPKGLETVEEYAFDYCSALSSIAFADSIEDIGKYAFDYCSSLTSISFPIGLISIGESAFHWCTNLTYVLFAENIKTLGVSSFSSCGSLRDVVIKATEPPTLHGTFSNIHENAVLYVPSGYEQVYMDSDWAQYFSQITELE